jgi:hypothetical protein
MTALPSQFVEAFRSPRSIDYPEGKRAAIGASRDKVRMADIIETAIPCRNFVAKTGGILQGAMLF